MATPTTTMRLTATDRRRLDRLAAARGVDRTAVVRRLIAEADDVPSQQARLTEDELVAVVLAATESSWQPARWLLERRWPERWGPTRRAQPEPGEPEPTADDAAFHEVDELARRRRRP